MGTLRDVTGGYTGGLLVLAAALALEAVLVLSLRLPDAPSETRAPSRSPRSVAASRRRRGPHRRLGASAAPRR